MHSTSTTKYLSLASQMLITLGAMVFAGVWIDNKLLIKIPLFTITLPLVAIIAILLKIINESNKPTK